METYRRNSTGVGVAALQRLLIDAGFLPRGDDDGIFGGRTETALRRWQGSRGLAEDGVAGPATLAAAGLLAKGAKAKPMTNLDRVRVFGRFRYSPVSGEKGQVVKVLDNWEARNIVILTTPLLAPIGVHRIRLHHKVAPHFLRFLDLSAKRGVLGDLLSSDGGYNPRFRTGSTSTLSAHAWGSSFDINARFNAYGVKPAPPGARGSVHRLVPIAEECGFLWGGYWNTPDGMHFEMGDVF